MSDCLTPSECIRATRLTQLNYNTAEKMARNARHEKMRAIEKILVIARLGSDVNKLIMSYLPPLFQTSLELELFPWSTTGYLDSDAVELTFFRIGSYLFGDTKSSEGMSWFRQIGPTISMSKKEKKKLRKKLRTFFDEFAKLNLDGVEKTIRELKTCNNPVVADLLIALLDFKECPFDFQVDKTGKNVTLVERFEVEKWLLEDSTLTNQTREDFLSEVVQLLRVETLEAVDKLFPKI